MIKRTNLPRKITHKSKWIWKQQKELVLARLESTDSKAVIVLDNKEYTVRDLRKHVKKEDELGKNIVNVQIRMIQTLADVKDIKKMERIKRLKCDKCGFVKAVNKLDDNRFYCPKCNKNLGIKNE